MEEIYLCLHCMQIVAGVDWTKHDASQEHLDALARAVSGNIKARIMAVRVVGGYGSLTLMGENAERVLEDKAAAALNVS